jgi:hypothetical protein
MSLYQDWINAKESERIAVEKRREIEDQLSKSLGITETDEGSKTIVEGEYKVKITMRLNRKVDTDMVQEIAAEVGVSNKLIDLFRWKAEINASEMKKQPEEIRNALARAVTVTPGRPSYSIEKIEE